MKSIAWGITGAGAYLEESIEVIEEISKLGLKVTAFVSRAGEQVLEMYGLRSRLENTLRGEYPVGVVYESAEPPGYPATGRLYLGVYSAVVVSPATLNTVAKIIHGISDTLVTNLVAHSVKAGLPVYILPVDLYEVKSRVPLYVDRSKCNLCSECAVVPVCPTEAAKPHPYYKVVVDLRKCTRCFACTFMCPHNAIRFNVEIVVHPVPYYVEIIKKLEHMPRVRIIKHPSEITSILVRSLRE